MNETILKGKQTVIDEISNKIEGAQSVVLAEYQGLSVAQFEDLRTQLRNEGVELKIYKNTLTQRAVEKTGHGDLRNDLVGPNAIAFSNDDVVAAARIMVDFSKENEALKIKSGIVEGNVVDIKTITEIASLPSREGLLSMLLSCLQAPARDMAMITDAVARKVEETGVETAGQLEK